MRNTPASQGPTGRSAAPEGDRNFGIAIARAFDLLRCYSPEQPVLGISDLARATGLPKATVSRLTYTLEQLGYLHRSLPSGKYSLGWGVLSLGYPLLNGTALRQRARPAMLELATRLRVNVNLGTLDRLRILYIESVRFDESSLARPDIGRGYPILTSATGRVLLASLPTHRAEPLCKRLGLADPEAWRQTEPIVRQLRHDLQSPGFYARPSVVQPGFWAVAVPMKQPDHEPPMAFNCAMPLSQYSQRQLDRLVGPTLVAMVRAVEER